MTSGGCGTDAVYGTSARAGLCRHKCSSSTSVARRHRHLWCEHGLGPNPLSPWKATFLHHAHAAFRADGRRSDEAAEIAERERLVGRLTMGREVLKSLDPLGLDPRCIREAAMRLAGAYPTAAVCRVLDLPRGSYYRRGPVAEGIEALLGLAARWPTYGYRRLTAILRRQGWRVDAKWVRRLMREPHLAAALPGTQAPHDEQRTRIRSAGGTIDNGPFVGCRWL